MKPLCLKLECSTYYRCFWLFIFKENILNAKIIVNLRVRLKDACCVPGNFLTKVMYMDKRGFESIYRLSSKKNRRLCSNTI